jgi:hypothetical protein
MNVKALLQLIDGMDIASAKINALESMTRDGSKLHKQMENLLEKVGSCRSFESFTSFAEKTEKTASFEAEALAKNATSIS